MIHYILEIPDIQPFKNRETHQSLKIGDKIAARIERSPATQMYKLTVTDDAMDEKEPGGDQGCSED